MKFDSLEGEMKIERKQSEKYWRIFRSDSGKRKVIFKVLTKYIIIF